MWFTENPWPPIVILIALAAVLVGLWTSQRRALWLVAAAVAVAGCFAIYFVERQIVTEPERIAQHVFDMTSAFRQKDEKKTLSYFSKQAPELHDLVVNGIKMIDVDDDLSIKDMSVRLISGGSQALSHFRANATVHVGGAGSPFGGFGGKGISRWELRWQKEGGDWKVVEVTRLSPTKDERMPPLDLRQQ